MSHIKVEFAKLQEIGKEYAADSKRILQAKEDFQSSINRLDWEVKTKANIRARAVKLSNRLIKISSALMRYNSYINQSYKSFSDLESYKGNQSVIKQNQYATQKTTDKLTTKEKTTYTEYEKTTIVKEDNVTGTFTETINQKTYETETSPQGIKRKSRTTVYETKFEGRNGYVNDGYDIYMGIVETDYALKSDLAKLLTGGYVEGESYDLIDAHSRVGVTGLNYKIYAEGKKDSLGANADWEVGIGKVEAGAGGKIGIKENGDLVADVGVELMVTAIEGEIKGTVDVGFLEAQTKVKAYVGSVGLEGGVSYDGGKLNVKIGASLGIGIGVDVTIEPSGFFKDIIDNYQNFKNDVENVSKYGCGYVGHLFGFW